MGQIRLTTGDVDVDWRAVRELRNICESGTLGA
jgi:hypothetical protein